VKYISIIWRYKSNLSEKRFKRKVLALVYN
jgi:hypothetical protein